MVVEWWQDGSKTVAFFHHAGSCEDAEAVGRGPGRRKKPYRYAGRTTFATRCSPAFSNSTPTAPSTN